jgi:hypothetical protein
MSGMRGGVGRMALAWTLALSVLGLAGCTSSVRRGTTLYADGRYIEAAEVFERNEDQLRQFPPEEQAEYGVYRAMTLQALGDVRNAKLWLGYAEAVEQANPGSLTAEGRALLGRARREFARNDEIRATLPLGTAIAASQPSPPVTPRAITSDRDRQVAPTEAVRSSTPR